MRSLSSPLCTLIAARNEKKHDGPDGSTTTTTTTRTTTTITLQNLTGGGGAIDEFDTLFAIPVKAKHQRTRQKVS